MNIEKHTKKVVTIQPFRNVLYPCGVNIIYIVTGISIAAIQKLLDQLIQKKYVERGEKDGSWRVFVTQ